MRRVHGREHRRLGKDRRTRVDRTRSLGPGVLERLGLEGLSARLGEVVERHLARLEARDDHVRVRGAELEREDVGGRLEHVLRVDRVRKVPQEDEARHRAARGLHAFIEGEGAAARGRDHRLRLPLDRREQPPPAVREMEVRLELLEIAICLVSKRGVLIGEVCELVGKDVDDLILLERLVERHSDLVQELGHRRRVERLHLRLVRNVDRRVLQRLVHRAEVIRLRLGAVHHGHGLDGHVQLLAPQLKARVLVLPAVVLRRVRVVDGVPIGEAVREAELAPLAHELHHEALASVRDRLLLDLGLAAERDPRLRRGRHVRLLLLLLLALLLWWLAVRGRDRLFLLLWPRRLLCRLLLDDALRLLGRDANEVILAVCEAREWARV